MGWRSEGLGGREVSLSFSPRQLLLSKSVLVIRQAVSCCPLLVPRVLESPLSGISPGDLFVVFPSFDCFFPLSVFFRVLPMNVYHGGVFLSFPLVINTESDFGLDFFWFYSDGDRSSGTVHLLVTVNSSVSFFVWNECSLLFWDCSSACNCELFGKFLCLE